jgi:hypothetical protein
MDGRAPANELCSNSAGLCNATKLYCNERSVFNLRKERCKEIQCCGVVRCLQLFLSLTFADVKNIWTCGVYMYTVTVTAPVELISAVEREGDFAVRRKSPPKQALDLENGYPQTEAASCQQLTVSSTQFCQ